MKIKLDQGRLVRLVINVARPLVIEETKGGFPTNLRIDTTLGLGHDAFTLEQTRDSVGSRKRP